MTAALYKALLRLYPYDYRALFGAEMVQAFAQQPRCCAAAELCSLVTGAAGEWFAKLTTNRTLRGRTLPDIRMMRPVGVSRQQWFSSRCSPDT